MEALEAIKIRKSIRAYKKDKIDKETIKEIINAGRLSATAMNIQPWQFVVVTNEETLKNIASCMNHSQFVGDAPLNIFVLSKTDAEYGLEDCSAASQNMLIACTALNLSACWVAGDKQSYAQDILKILEIPEDYKLISIISIGYENETPKPQEKKSIEEITHWEKFSRKE